eukprot:8528512-Pyramimonas_sp.AAC.2
MHPSALDISSTPYVYAFASAPSSSNACSTNGATHLELSGMSAILVAMKTPVTSTVPLADRTVGLGPRVHVHRARACR